MAQSAGEESPDHVEERAWMEEALCRMRGAEVRSGMVGGWACELTGKHKA
jgi:hypothetical protein